MTRGAGKGQPSTGLAPTVSEIQSDILSHYAAQYWAPHSDEVRLPYDPSIIEKIYHQELATNRFPIRRIVLLEYSQYLENYLWPNYDPRVATLAHTISICMMVNEKFRERVPAWDGIKKHPDSFEGFFHHVLDAALLSEYDVSMKEHCIVLVFLIHCFGSLELDIIQARVHKLLSLAMWCSILPGRLEQELKTVPRYAKFWARLEKKDATLSEDMMVVEMKERKFMSNLIKKFLDILNKIPVDGTIDFSKKNYCERFLELMIDLEALLPTRRFFNVLLDDHHVVGQCRLSNLAKRTDGSGRLFNQLLEMLQFYAGFEINDVTGEELNEHDTAVLHNRRVAALQRKVFSHFRSDLLDFCLSNISNIDTHESLTAHLGRLSKEQLHELAASLNLVPHHNQCDNEGNTNSLFEKEFLLELIVSRYERRRSQIQKLNETPMYPTEEMLWDENLVPSGFYSEGCLALPKLNLQYLTLHDYLLRNHNLFQLESTYEIREDIESAISRMKPWQNEHGETSFGGWARMALPIVSFSVVEVAKPHVGYNHPSRVRADVKISVQMRQEIRHEWESLRRHDPCFLVTVRPAYLPGEHVGTPKTFKEQFGIEYVRGCEIEGMLDDEGKVIEEGPEPKPKLSGDSRTYRVWLDPRQYARDINWAQQGEDDVYATFNVILRRKPKENNFKAVLETIRDLMNTECVVPDWLHDIILGYDDPAAAHYSRMPNRVPTLDFFDTFLSCDHVRSAFPGYEIKFSSIGKSELQPPFRISFPFSSSGNKKPKVEVKEEAVIHVDAYAIPNRGPYPYNRPKRNMVPFTATQIEAIKSGMQPGLTMVVGPPGTGKTDVAVQIISNLYHSFPEQRTLIVTHSNQALNQLFEKIIALDIDERHCLRLGHGEETLETEKDFSRYGRVNYVLSRRIALLAEAQRLQESLKIYGDMTFTCETASHFFLYQIMSRWEEFLSKVYHRKEDRGAVSDLFPFIKFFSNAPQPLFKNDSYDEDLEIAKGCFMHIKSMFEELEEYRAFELIRSGADRSKYLLIKTAKIIAMTCTHAALRRRDLVELSFKYDNVLMEEAAQILEIETFIPLLLQNPEDGRSRLKRIILIGDHHQLPPVIKNMAFQKYSNMEQSLFTRFIRLGVPYVELDAQGRARPSICSLYSWRYDKLGNLPRVLTEREFTLANPGFAYDYQLINIGDFNGIGESEPNPFFYQNLGEAEYASALFMYMRLMGYPADKISIITTYNGQKHLIRDVINKRFGDNPLIGRPHKVTTVDRYQGQQNDYIILSLVRTKAVGHLRDVRRLVVALSRARLGLYILARVNLFQNCYELTPAFCQLTSRPQQLWLCPWESHSGSRPASALPGGTPLVIQDVAHMAKYTYDLYMEVYRQLQHQKEMAEAMRLSAPRSPEEKAPEASSSTAPSKEPEPIVNEIAISDAEMTQVYQTDEKE